MRSHGLIHSTKEVKTMTDLQGPAAIREQLAGEALKALGATAVPIRSRRYPKAWRSAPSAPRAGSRPPSSCMNW